MPAKIGYAEGKCPRCGKTLRRQRPADYAICDCYLFCPYEPERGLHIFYVCNNHTPPDYSKQKPIEVKLF